MIVLIIVIIFFFGIKFLINSYTARADEHTTSHILKEQKINKIKVTNGLMALIHLYSPKSQL